MGGSLSKFGSISPTTTVSPTHRDHRNSGNTTKSDDHRNSGNTTSYDDHRITISNCTFNTNYGTIITNNLQHIEVEERQVINSIGHDSRLTNLVTQAGVLDRLEEDAKVGNISHQQFELLTNGCQRIYNDINRSRDMKLVVIPAIIEANITADGYTGVDIQVHGHRVFFLIAYSSVNHPIKIEQRLFHGTACAAGSYTIRQFTKNEYEHFCEISA
ncbi:hypothetical protein V1525DRAFT_422330 [Lipomyces kononenkoae]|uniref:Uncharacterized protein n=1 Tax=Lipomyces kononenkoae TaxID=34357 RepID=A0ACC3SSI3_LIPKO